MANDEDRQDTEIAAEQAPPVAPPPPFSPLRTSLSQVQTVVGLATGIVSITGALLSSAHYLQAPPGNGHLVAIVQDRGERVVRDATVEVLTPQNAVVTTLAANAAGQVRVPIQQGSYLLRVKHPRLGVETRVVEVRAGQTAQVRVSLPGTAAAPAGATGATPDSATPGPPTTGAVIPAPRPAATPPASPEGLRLANESATPVRGASQAP
jgi:hypothetical protein